MFRMPGVELELMGIAQYRHPRIISVHCLVCRPRRMSRIKHVVYEDGNPVGWYGPDHVEMQRQCLRGEVLLLDVIEGSMCIACQCIDNRQSCRLTDFLGQRDRKSTRLNSSHANISYAVFCLKKKKK